MNIAALANWLFSFAGGALSALWSAAKLFLALGSFVVALGTLLYNFVDVAAGLDNITYMVGTATVLLQSLPLLSVMDKLNRVLPLNEFLALSGLYLSVKMLALISRLLIRVATLGLG